MNFSTKPSPATSTTVLPGQKKIPPKAGSFNDLDKI